MLNSRNTSNRLHEERESLLTLNNDMLYWVYKISKKWWKIKLSLEKDLLVCYENKFDKIKWLKENPSINILDIEEFRNKKLKVLKWKTSKNIDNLVLLSGSVIELIKIQNPKWWFRYHTYTSLRDWWSSDELKRTWVAGRNIGENLLEEVEREYSEESPFLSQVDWVWTLSTPDRKNKADAIADLKTSVEYFLKNKYNLDRNNPEQAEFVKMFERSFRWKIKYEELWDILKETILNNRIEFFENNELDTFPWLEKDMKHVEILDDNWKVISSGNYFVYHDEANNTIEYRSLREIKIPEWFNPRQRLFLESQNQYAKTHRLGDLCKENLVPTMKHFAEKVKDIL